MRRQRASVIRLGGPSSAPCAALVNNAVGLLRLRGRCGVSRRPVASSGGRGRLPGRGRMAVRRHPAPETRYCIGNEKGAVSRAPVIGMAVVPDCTCSLELRPGYRGHLVVIAVAIAVEQQCQRVAAYVGSELAVGAGDG